MSKCVQQNTWLKVLGDSMKSIRKWISWIIFKSHPIAITVSGVVNSWSNTKLHFCSKNCSVSKNLWIIFFFWHFMKARNLERKRERKEKINKNGDVCGFPSKAMAIVYTHRALEQQITKSSPIYCHRKSRTRAKTYFVLLLGRKTPQRHLCLQTENDVILC